MLGQQIISNCKDGILGLFKSTFGPRQVSCFSHIGLHKFINLFYENSFIIQRNFVVWNLFNENLDINGSVKLNT